MSISRTRRVPSRRRIITRHSVINTTSKLRHQRSLESVEPSTRERAEDWNTSRAFAVTVLGASTRAADFVTFEVDSGRYNATTVLSLGFEILGGGL